MDFEAYRRKGSKSHSKLQQGHLCSELRLTHLFGKLKDQWFNVTIPGLQVTKYIYTFMGEVTFGTPWRVTR